MFAVRNPSQAPPSGKEMLRYHTSGARASSRGTRLGLACTCPINLQILSKWECSVGPNSASHPLLVASARGLKAWVLECAGSNLNAGWLTLVACTGVRHHQLVVWKHCLPQSQQCRCRSGSRARGKCPIPYTQGPGPGGIALYPMPCTQGPGPGGNAGAPTRRRLVVEPKQPPLK